MPVETSGDRPIIHKDILYYIDFYPKGDVYSIHIKEIEEAKEWNKVTRLGYLWGEVVYKIAPIITESMICRY